MLKVVALAGVCLVRNEQASSSVRIDLLMPVTKREPGVREPIDGHLRILVASVRDLVIVQVGADDANHRSVIEDGTFKEGRSRQWSL